MDVCGQVGRAEDGTKEDGSAWSNGVGDGDDSKAGVEEWREGDVLKMLARAENGDAGDAFGSAALGGVFEKRELGFVADQDGWAAAGEELERVGVCGVDVARGGGIAVDEIGGDEGPSCPGHGSLREVDLIHEERFIAVAGVFGVVGVDVDEGEGETLGELMKGVVESAGSGGTVSV